VLLIADWVVPVSAPPLADGGLWVKDGVIGAVGPAAELRARFPDDAAEVFPGCALLPGLVNAHTHLEYSAFRGFARPGGFGAWMLRLLLARRKLSPADYEAAAVWGAHECLRSGVTSVADCSYEGRAVARAAGAAGLRARVYQEVFGVDDAALPDVMEGLERRLDRLRAEAGPLLEVGVSPHAPYTVSARLYREAARFARRAGLRLATHLAESPAEVEMLARGGGAIARAYRLARVGGGGWAPPGVSPVRYVAQAGALGPTTLAVHAVQVDGDDIALLAASGAAVAHCPRSNLRLRCGAAPVAALRREGVTVALGTDSLASNEDLDLFAEMRAALAVSGGRRPGPAAAGGTQPAGPGAAGLPLTSTEVLRMATLDGARALGWDHLVGSLEVGKQADIIAVALPQPVGPGGPAAARGGGEGDGVVEAIVASAAADSVRMTMVAGKRVHSGGLVPAAVRAGLAAARARLGLRDEDAGFGGRGSGIGA
jgi:5-methylthioadenosine/S-adenosylhomocysteine deaminase